MSAAVQAPGSFVRRLVDVVITLGRGQFGESGTDTVTLSGLRCSANRGAAVPLISPSTGMVGYPAKTQFGVTLTALYNPAVVIGGNIRVETSNTPAAGLWNVTALAHTLESETPGGQWFTAITAVTPGIV